MGGTVESVRRTVTAETHSRHETGRIRPEGEDAGPVPAPPFVGGAMARAKVYPSVGATALLATIHEWNLGQALQATESEVDE